MQMYSSFFRDLPLIVHEVWVGNSSNDPLKWPCFASRCVVGSKLGNMVGVDWATTSWYLGMGTTSALGLGCALFRSGLVTNGRK